MNRLLNNWKLKLFSLLLAVGLWSHVRGEVNPWETASFRVPLQGAPPSRLLVLRPEKIPREVRVTLRAPRARLRELKGFAPPNPLAPLVSPGAPGEAPTLNTPEVRASLDFSRARRGEQDVPVRARAALEDVEVIGVKPAVVALALDRAEEQELAIEAEPAPARGYRIDSLRVERGTATAFGPARALEQVATLRARVRSGPLKLNRSAHTSVAVEPLDAEGKLVADVSVEPRTVSAFAVLREEVLEKAVPLEARLSNAPANVAASGAQVLPALIRVRGPLLEVEKIGALRLEVDASGGPDRGRADEFWQRRVRVTLPPRVRAVGSDQVLVRAPLR
jgi:YbbR domain-containing protein